MVMMAAVTIMAFLAGFLQAVTGFGGALVLMMVLPYFVPMNTATALAGFICVPMCLAIAANYRKKVRIRFVLVPTIIYFISCSICIRIAASINLDRMKAVFGLLLIFLAVYFYFISGRLRLKGDFKTALVCAGISGITGGLFGIGGPLLVLYYLAIMDEKEEYLGTINLVFFFTESFSALIRYLNGLITVHMLPIAGFGVLSILIGRYFGTRIADCLDGEKMRKVIYILLAVSGIITFLKAVG